MRRLEKGNDTSRPNWCLLSILLANCHVVGDRAPVLTEPGRRVDLVTVGVGQRLTNAAMRVVNQPAGRRPAERLRVPPQRCESRGAPNARGRGDPIIARSNAAAMRPRTPGPAPPNVARRRSGRRCLSPRWKERLIYVGRGRPRNVHCGVGGGSQRLRSLRARSPTSRPARCPSSPAAERRSTPRLDAMTLPDARSVSIRRRQFTWDSGPP